MSATRENMCRALARAIAHHETGRRAVNGIKAREQYGKRDECVRELARLIKDMREGRFELA